MKARLLIKASAISVVIVVTYTPLVSAAQEFQQSHMGHGMSHMMGMVEKLDADKDGTITQAEIDSRNQQRLNEYDADQNTSLNIGEYEKMWLKKMRHRMVDKFQHLDEDGDGEVTQDEFSAPLQMMMSHHDSNNDSVLTLDELQSMKHGRQHGQHHKQNRRDMNQTPE